MTNFLLYAVGGKILFLSFSLLLLVFFSLQMPSFHYSVRILYIVLINLAAFWFGLKGGLIMAFLSVFVFFLESAASSTFQYSTLLAEGFPVRIVAYFSGAFIIGYLADREKKLKDQLNHLAYYDELTGCSNYRLIMDYLERSLHQSRRNNEELIIIMADLDNFKELNDSCGHLKGNEYLKWYAAVLKESIRAMDTIGRYGGDEFLCILPDCSVSQALQVLDRIKENLARAHHMPPSLKADYCKRLKFSAGLASFPYNGETLQEVVNAADNALYQAKRRGRDAVVVERRKTVRFENLESLKMEIIDVDAAQLNALLSINDISRTGMSFSSPGDIEKDGFFCKMHYPDWGEPQELFCRVVHKQKKEEQLYQFGVHFVEVPDRFGDSFSRLAQASRGS